MKKQDKLILWFDELGIDDVPLVGGKNASLGEMYSNLVKKGINIPNGFATTSKAYWFFIKKNELDGKIKKVLAGLNTSDMRNLSEKGMNIRNLILNSEFPEELDEEIKKAYKKLCIRYGENTDVAVRSSATAEDLPDASFAGQQETFLNIKGEKELLEVCKKCFASLFTNRAISYRFDKKFDQFSVALSIGIQKMVRSDKAGSGVIFTIDTETGFKDAILITGSYGLGENIVQGKVTPDEFFVFKPTLETGYKPIIQKMLGDKKIKMVYSSGKGKTTINIPATEKEINSYVLNDDEIIKLAKWGVEIEKYYSDKAKKFKPMDLEWAKDGLTNELFIVQARPETVHSMKKENFIETYKILKKSKVLLTGKSVGGKIAKGQVNIIKNPSEIQKFKPGQILVTEITDPDWQPIMKMASAIITEKGGRTCHAAIVARELGIPAIVGSENATKILKNSQKITVSCAEGEMGFVYEGFVNFKKIITDIKKIPETITKIMINTSDPQKAFSQAFLPVAGVGLARQEFIVNSFIKIHPMAALYPEKTDDKTRKIIKETIRPYKNAKEFYIDKLAEGISMIAASVFPKPAIVRLSDFKSNEYKNLVGGKFFEPEEENPMLGWRGASRYYSKKFSEAFKIECLAIKKAREVFGLKNIQIMVPFCRTVDEGEKVLDVLEKNGLKKGENGLKVIMMCEIPANIILAKEFLKIFDGFSIGSNDLTQLTLGIDRDSEFVSYLYDEKNLAVKKMLEQVIESANIKGKYIGICGQAPSDFPEFTKFLIRNKIKSISLNPDSVIKTILLIAKEEKFAYKNSK